MRYFRRCGLEDDDEVGASPVNVSPRSRPADDDDSSSGASAVEYESAWEEESLVSAMTTASDLESVYYESASNKSRPLNRRERFLLQHSLPEPSRTVSAILSERRGRSNASATIANAEKDDDDYSDGAIENPWLEPRREPWGMAYPGKVFLDPNEKETTGDFQEEVAVWHIREDIHLARILERDESTQSSSSNESNYMLYNSLPKSRAGRK